MIVSLSYPGWPEIGSNIIVSFKCKIKQCLDGINAFGFGELSLAHSKGQKIKHYGWINSYAIAENINEFKTYP